MTCEALATTHEKFAFTIWVRVNGETHSMREFNRTDELQGHIRDMRDTLQRDGWTADSTKKR